MEPTPLPPPMPRPNWFGRNWKWVVPLGCLLPVFFVVGCGLLAFLFATGVMKQSDAYKIALARAQANPVLIEAIGSPISQTGIVSGNSNVSGAVGEANMIWGAHAPSRARDGASPSRTFPFQSIAARRRNEHARRVRSPDSLATHC